MLSEKASLWIPLTRTFPSALTTRSNVPSRPLARLPRPAPSRPKCKIDPLNVVPSTSPTKSESSAASASPAVKPNPVRKFEEAPPWTRTTRPAPKPPASLTRTAPPGTRRTSCASGIVPAGTTSCPSAVTGDVRVSASGMEKSVSPVAAPPSSPPLSATKSVPAASRSKPPRELKPVAIVVDPPPSSRMMVSLPAPKLPWPTSMAPPRRTTPPCTVPGVGMLCAA